MNPKKKTKIFSGIVDIPAENRILELIMNHEVWMIIKLHNM